MFDYLLYLLEENRCKRRKKKIRRLISKSKNSEEIEKLKQELKLLDFLRVDDVRFLMKRYK